MTLQNWQVMTKKGRQIFFRKKIGLKRWVAASGDTNPSDATANFNLVRHRKITLNSGMCICIVFLLFRSTHVKPLIALLMETSKSLANGTMSCKIAPKNAAARQISFSKGTQPSTRTDHTLVGMVNRSPRPRRVGRSTLLISRCVQVGSSADTWLMRVLTC